MTANPSADEQFRQNNMKTASLLQLWQKSHWLGRSKEAYAKHFHNEAWTEAKEIRGNKHWLELVVTGLGKAYAESDGDPAQISKQANKMAAIEKPLSDLLEQAGSQILAHLRKGTYRGFGFDRPRTVDTSPVLIPPECWSGTVIWQNNELRFQSLKFSDVRLRMVAEKIVTLTDRSLAKPEPAKGRPTIKPYVEAAFHALNKKEKIDCSKSASSHFDLVRDWIASNIPDCPKPAHEIGNEGIRAHFSPLFKALKKNRIQ
jgi:hypothetical protein